MTGRVLGFDFGLKRTGVAVGQGITGTATPLTTLIGHNEEPDWTGITRLIEEWRPEALVVGLPLQMDGSPNPELHERIERFCRQLEGRYHLPVYRVDERLSSVEAQRRLKEQRQQGTRGRIRKEEIDALAAALQLETWLRNQRDRDER
ncbi:MAG: Holliday junction resolvase RuvX [Gammaproteobacteria bacterium]|nr:MAG: Holliday junction resolvase RuvX [Gammaproteobacteria bacterium]